MKVRVSVGSIKKTALASAVLALSKKKLFEIFRSPLRPFALRAFGEIFNFSFFEHGLHYDFSAAVGTHEFMR